MPRARKTMSGAKPMTALNVPGQMYGKGVEQQKLQKAMPAPQAQQQKAVPPQPERQRQVPAAAPAPSSAPSPKPQGDPVAAMKQMAGKVGLLTAPTARPDEPLTAGLPYGPGPGPEALSMPSVNPTGDMLRMLARVVGDQYFAELATKAGL